MILAGWRVRFRMSAETSWRVRFNSRPPVARAPRRRAGSTGASSRRSPGSSHTDRPWRPSSGGRADGLAQPSRGSSPSRISLFIWSRRAMDRARIWSFSLALESAKAVCGLERACLVRISSGFMPQAQMISFKASILLTWVLGRTLRPAAW